MRPLTWQKYAVLYFVLMLMSCDKSSDEIQSEQQEHVLLEGTAQTGMPAIRNFQERKLAKTILEMRDQEHLATYTYVLALNTGRFIHFCDSVGFPLPYSAQYTSPQKVIRGLQGTPVVAQADPNGLFAPSSSRASWVLCKVPGVDEVKPVYSEADLTVSPFPLPGALDPGTDQPDVRVLPPSKYGAQPAR